PGTDEGLAIAIDATGSSYVTGDTDSNQFPVTVGAVQLMHTGKKDTIFVRLNETGTTLNYSTYLGGQLSDAGFGVAVDPDGSNAYLTGVASSPDFPVTLNGSQRQIGSDFNSDAFIAEISFGATSTIPVVAVGGVVNGASFGVGPVAPGSIMSIFGMNLAGSIANATNLPLPLKLSDVSVTINGISVPLYYVAPGQINAQVPFEIGPGSASIQVKTPAGAGTPVAIMIASTAPYLSTASNGRAVAQNQDGSLNSPGNPAKAGSVVVVYFTGVGPVDATVLNGTPSPFAISTQQSSATIGRVPATIQYIGLTPQSVGLAQANIEVPATLGMSDHPLVIRIGGAQSNSALISVTR
ncbi:MAG: SBBP repeat-containing protein, partial [Bryobacteraceae bacterium]